MLPVGVLFLLNKYTTLFCVCQPLLNRKKMIFFDKTPGAAPGVFSFGKERSAIAVHIFLNKLNDKSVKALPF